MCPRRSWTTFGFSPTSNSTVACVWHRPCSVITGSASAPSALRALAARRVNISDTDIGLRGDPLRVPNTTASVRVKSSARQPRSARHRLSTFTVSASMSTTRARPDLVQLQVDIARQAVGLGALSADELREWAVVLDRQNGIEAGKGLHPNVTTPQSVSTASEAHSPEAVESEPHVEPEPASPTLTVVPDPPLPSTTARTPGTVAMNGNATVTASPSRP